MTVLASEFFNGTVLNDPVDETQTIFSNVDNVGITAVSGWKARACKVAPTLANTAACRDSGFSTDITVARIEFQVAEYPSADCVILNAYDGDLVTGEKIGDVQFTTAGKLRLRNVWTTISGGISTTVIAVNTTYAIEWYIDTTQNIMALRIYSTLTKVATPLETVGGGANTASAGANTTQIQIGKMTSVTWANGLTFDSYRRCDNWYAQAAVDDWSESFSGSVGSTIAVNANISAITGTAPVVGAGGPHVDQKVCSFVQQSTQNKRIRSAGFSTPPTADAGGSRVYCRVPTAPADYTQRLKIWDAGGFASLVAVPGAGAGLINLELWNADEWKGAHDPNEGPFPQGIVYDVKVSEWFRIESSLYLEDIVGSSPHVNNVIGRVAIFPGAFKNLTYNGDKALSPPPHVTWLLSNASVPATTFQYTYLCQETESPTSLHVPVYFDEWIGNDTVSGKYPKCPIGPLSEEDAFDLPVGTQWAFSYWKDLGGGSFEEVPLTLEGSWSGSVINPINIGATEQWFPTADTSRFPGDQGIGKVLFGANKGDASGNALALYDWYNEKMALQATTISVAGTPRKMQLWRSFLDDPPSTGYSWGSNGTRDNNIRFSTRWVQFCHEQNCIPWLEIVFNTNGPFTQMYGVLLAQMLDAGLDSSAMTGELLTAYNYTVNTFKQLDPWKNNPIWYTVNHEPEDNIGGAGQLSYVNFRKAQRAFVLISRQLGYTNLAFVANLFTSWPFSLQNNNDDWRQWYSDWRGTSTNGATPHNPFPQNQSPDLDFYTSTQKQGGLNESVVDIIGNDIYFWDYNSQGGSEWEATDTVANANLFPSKATSRGWAPDFQLLWNQVKALGKPCAIGEMGTQAAGYYDLNINQILIQRPQDIQAMRDLGLALQAHIEAGNIVGMCYFNNGEHMWGFVRTNTNNAVSGWTVNPPTPYSLQSDPNYTKALPWAELYDRYAGALTIS